MIINVAWGGPDLTRKKSQTQNIIYNRLFFSTAEFLVSERSAERGAETERGNPFN